MSKGNEPAFRPVPDWPQYEVSADGVVRSWFIGGTRQQRRRHPRYKKAHKAKDGYWRVTFHEKRKGASQRVETFTLHRLVAICFIPTTDEALDVAHLDGNKNNNAASNLRWCTRKENESHKVAHGTAPRGERNGNAKFDSVSALAIRRLYSSGKLTQRDIAEAFGVGQQTICNVVNGKTHSLSAAPSVKGEE